MGDGDEDENYLSLLVVFLYFRKFHYNKSLLLLVLWRLVVVSTNSAPFSILFVPG